MIIQNSQRVAFHTGSHCEPAFEIHLPKLIGLGMLKSLPGFVFHRFPRINEAMSTQDFMDRTIGRNGTLADGLQPCTDFPSTPGRMTLANFQHLEVDVFAASLWRLVRPTRPIL